MKLLTLLTTLIITLASSNVFAKTFVCENWKWLVTNEEKEKTMFVGEKDNDTLTIKNAFKRKITLTYLGWDLDYKYYTYTDIRNNYIEIFSINNNVKKYSDDGKKELASYDFSITQILGESAILHTFCNYQ